MTKLVNDLGTAPGLYHSFNGKHIISLPGVPYEMKHLFTDRFLPIVKPLIKGEYLEQRTILTCGMGETDIAEKILDIETGLPQHINLAFLPDIGKVRLRLSGRGTDKNILSTEIKQIGDQYHRAHWRLLLWRRQDTFGRYLATDDDRTESYFGIGGKLHRWTYKRSDCFISQCISLFQWECCFICQ